MRILKNIFVLLMLFVASITSAQLTVSAEGGEAAMGSNLEVDITANMFHDLATFKFFVVWDSLVMEFVEVKNVNQDLLGYNFAFPGDGDIKKGEVSNVWTNPSGGVSLADDTRLFTLVLNATGVECATSAIGFSNEEAGDGNFQQVDVTSTGNDISVSGPDCSDVDDECVNECEGSTDVILSMPCITAAANSNVCIPITVFNFVDIEAVQAGILWDPTVLEYTGFQNLGFSSNAVNAGFGNNPNDSANGKFRLFWAEQTGSSPQSLDDGSVLIEICFDLIGNDGDVVSIDFGDIGSFGVEVVQSVDGSGIGVDFCINGGTITIGNPPPPSVQIIANDVSGLEGDEVCVDISVREFTDIRGYQGNLQWDESILDYSSVQMLNSALGLTVSDFNFTTGPANLRFTWDNLNPTTLADDTKLFQICFDIVGDCNSTPTSPVTFESTASSSIEFSDPTGMAIPFTVDNGSVTVLPCVIDHSCTLSTVTQPPCPGDNGSIAVIVEADNTCECNWYLNGGATSIQTTPGNGNCNLSGVGAGNYTFELSDASGTVVCTFDQVLTDPTPITTDPSVSNAGCGDTGSITVNAVGGTGSLTYTWVPNVSSTDSATDLPAGDYTITVMDNNSCSVIVMRTVTSDLDPLSFDANSATVTNPTCNGSSDGSISGAAIGGCPPYMYAYEGGSDTGLPSGDYGITVTDSNGNTAEGSVTLIDPAAISLASTVTDESAPNAMDGSITITATNGTAPFMYMWSPNTDNTDTASGLSGNGSSYNVTVSDANGCMASLSNIVVNTTPVGVDTPAFGTINTTDVINCFGDTTGSISSSIDGGIGTLTVVLSDPMETTVTLNSSGSFSFVELAAGTYTMTVTDSNGDSSTSEVVINQPSDLEAIIDTGEDNNNCDGFIDVVVTGGTMPYSYEWVNLSVVTPNLSNLCAGSYDLMVTDSNDCVLTLMDIIVGGGDEPDVPCWVPSNIITPNGDGKNDFFKFTCIGQALAGLQIFDRYGKEVYTNENYDNSFDGVSNSGGDLGEGGYMWVLTIESSTQQRRIEKGTLTLLRD